MSQDVTCVIAKQGMYGIAKPSKKVGKEDVLIFTRCLALVCKSE